MPPNALSPALTEILKATSRSFYLSLRWLPSQTRGPIGLTYLTARLADTLADTDALEPSERIGWLSAFRTRLTDSSAPWPSAAAARTGASDLTPGEARLVANAPAVLAAYDRLPDGDRTVAARVLGRIATGMAMDLERFGGASAHAPGALETRADLDRYCYLVAGSVGEFWTEIHALHLPAVARRAAGLAPLGIRFGMGLQLVNILRDLPTDLGRGRCYLPASELATQGLSPAGLGEPGAGARLQPVRLSLIDLAREHLEAGWAYLQRLPASERRLRLTCAWPLLIGIRTLGRLARVTDPLTSGQIKIRRSEVSRLVAESSLRAVLPYALDPMWRRECSAAGL